jgi:hypothetical protein
MASGASLSRLDQEIFGACASRDKTSWWLIFPCQR